MRSTAKLVALGLAGWLVAACQELGVTNPNNPDRGQATGQPAAVEALVSSAFTGWWNTTHQNEPTWAVSTMADEFTGGFLDFGLHHSSMEPRQAWNNNPTFANNDASETPWYGLHSVVSNVNDALAAMNAGVRPADSARARAVAKFMQGVAHGTLALLFDSAYAVNELLDFEISRPQLSPASEVMDSAINELEQAIAIAQANTFAIPGAPSWFRTPLTNTDLVRLGHSFIARFLVSLPRDRAGRDAVDWERALAEAEQGIQTDLQPVAEPLVFENGFTFRAARKRASQIPSDFARPDNWLFGPADSTNAFISWVNTPVQSRDAFATTLQIRTKDRRIHGATPTDSGKYFLYFRASIWAATRGTYIRSNYAFTRLGTGTSWQLGPQLALTVTEVDLIRAEALIRLNRAGEAIPLINKTRVANGQLPPVSIDGPPDEPSCVPRKFMPGPTQGQCGSLWDALRYEKRIEMAGIDPLVAYADARGWQSLIEDTYVHFPVPGRELETKLQPLYTYGGGLAGSAPAPEPERCPVPLPRCP